mmetsp:Transcript_7759/g.22080  ORF Transcript_7759/g.22080 Transcript_7759/m.22080 type:complete len:204 (+) Transcript_7759:580-1191(+)
MHRCIHAAFSLPNSLHTSFPRMGLPFRTPAAYIDEASTTALPPKEAQASSTSWPSSAPKARAAMTAAPSAKRKGERPPEASEGSRGSTKMTCSSECLSMRYCVVGSWGISKLYAPGMCDSSSAYSCATSSRAASGRNGLRKQRCSGSRCRKWCSAAQRWPPKCSACAACHPSKPRVAMARTRARARARDDLSRGGASPPRPPP